MEFTTPSPSSSQSNHPYSIKTTQSGILSRSNVGKAHGSWARHQYVPAPPSPSMFVFNPEATSPSPKRHRNAGDSGPKEVNGGVVQAASPMPSPSEKSHKSQKSRSVSSSPSKSPKTWTVRNDAGESVKLPKHPYVWTPSQLALYLSSELYDGDGVPFEPEIIRAMVDFVQKQKISGRTFLTLEKEDFEEMEAGVGSVWGNAFWDASCTLRQQALPYRPSRVSSSSYKPGRVRGMVDVFERSASENSDAGEDRSPRKTRLGTPEKPHHTPQRSTPIIAHKRGVKRRQNTFWDMSETEADTDADNNRRKGTSPLLFSPEVPSRDSPANNPFVSTPYPRHHTPALPDQNDQDIMPLLVANEPENNDDESSLVPVLNPPSATPLDAVLPEIPAEDATTPQVAEEDVGSSSYPSPFREPDTVIREDDDDDSSTTPHNTTTREIEIASLPPAPSEEPAEGEDEELSMSELYERTYNEPAPEPRRVLSVASSSSETVRFRPMREAEQASPTRPPTALRPIKGISSSLRDKNKEAVVTAPSGSQAPPIGLESLFEPQHDTRPSPNQEIYVVSSSSSSSSSTTTTGPPVTDREAAALRAVDVLKARLEIVEAKLAAMEKTEAEQMEKELARRRSRQQKNPANNNVRERFNNKRIEVLLDTSSENGVFDMPAPRPIAHRRAQSVTDILFGDRDAETYSNSSAYAGTTTIRTWQSASILLAGATTGMSVMLIPLLLRHLFRNG